MASVPVLLEDKNNGKEYILEGPVLDIYEDKTRNLTIEDVSSVNFQKNFLQSSVQMPHADNPTSAYWIRIQVQNKSTAKTGWLLEMYEFRTDSVELYSPLPNGNYEKQSGGFAYAFESKKYKHKNYVFDIHVFEEEPKFYYLRIVSSRPVGIIGVIRTIYRFTHYATLEYFFLSLFYGILLSIVVYNLFLYFSVLDKTYLFYVFYLTSFGIYATCLDGFGFQFLWPSYPMVNKHITEVSLLVVVISLMFYVKAFLMLKEKSPKLNTLFNYLIAIRILLFIIGLSAMHDLLYLYIPHFDILCQVVAFIVGIKMFQKGFTPARYYILGFSFFFIGFTISTLDSLVLIPTGIWTNYGINFGSSAEMMLLSLALADRIKILVKEKQVAQNEIIVQLTEKEELKDQINKQLEYKVYERTKELEHKNKQLDAFVYKASHDIKGPLKSVIGLTQTGLKDVQDAKAQEYFDHILKSTSRLDKLLAELLSLTMVQQATVTKEAIHFKNLLDEILSSFENFEGYQEVKFEITNNLPPNYEFHSDRKLIYSVLQNLIENSIKYRKPSCLDSHCKITISIINKNIHLVFSDNGIGIPNSLHEKIFDMFFKVNESSHGTGLGLHITKLAVEKLNGKIEFESELEKGTQFFITI